MSQSITPGQLDPVSILRMNEGDASWPIKRVRERALHVVWREGEEHKFETLDADL
jgi:hypothetical protein